MFVAAVTVNLRSLGSRSFGFGCVRVQDLEGGGGGRFSVLGFRASLFGILRFSWWLQRSDLCSTNPDMPANTKGRK